MSTPNLLVLAPLAVPPGWPPDVNTDDIIEAIHVNRVRDSVFQWPGDVNAGGHDLVNVKDIYGKTLISDVSIFVRDPSTLAVLAGIGQDGFFSGKGLNVTGFGAGVGGATVIGGALAVANAANSVQVATIGQDGVFRGAGVLVTGDLGCGGNVAAKGLFFTEGLHLGGLTVIDASGVFHGAGVDVNGSIVTRAQWIGVMNAAASAWLGYINDAGAFVGTGVNVTGNVTVGANVSVTNGGVEKVRLQSDGAVLAGSYYLKNGTPVIDGTGAFVGAGVNVPGQVQTNSNIVSFGGTFILTNPGNTAQLAVIGQDGIFNGKGVTVNGLPGMTADIAIGGRTLQVRGGVVIGVV